MTIIMWPGLTRIEQEKDNKIQVAGFNPTKYKLNVR